MTSATVVILRSTSISCTLFWFLRIHFIYCAVWLMWPFSLDTGWIDCACHGLQKKTVLADHFSSIDHLSSHVINDLTRGPPKTKWEKFTPIFARDTLSNPDLEGKKSDERRTQHPAEPHHFLPHQGWKCFTNPPPNGSGLWSWEAWFGFRGLAVLARLTWMNYSFWWRCFFGSFSASIYIQPYGRIWFRCSDCGQRRLLLGH